jgi:hypothetical protein
VWTTLVEVKTGANRLAAEQVECYLDIAREQGFDAVVTVSNEIPAIAGQHPRRSTSAGCRRSRCSTVSWTQVPSEAGDAEGAPRCCGHRSWNGADQRDFEGKLRLLRGLSNDELRALAGGLAQSALDSLKAIGVLSEPRSLASLAWRELSDLTPTSSAGRTLCSGCGTSSCTAGAARPDATLADVLKPERREFVVLVARELRYAGFHDLDELSPPDLMTGE